MILYTPLTAEEVFPSPEEEFTNRECVNYQQRAMYVEKNQNGNYQLIQLLSTDPSDFLKQEFQPGTILK